MNSFVLQGEEIVNGINISIENRAGSVRSGLDKDGHEWSIIMNYDYGYIKGTRGHDKEHIDVYVGPDKNSDSVFVVHQKDPVSGKYDEDKVMLGFSSFEDAKQAYLSQYDRPGFFGDMVETTIDSFKKELMDNARNINVITPEPTDDLSIAEKMASGEIPGIVATDKCLLVPMRITGTGVTQRKSKDDNGVTISFEIERPAETFLSERFLKQCAGLPVAYLHPGSPDGNGYTSINFDNWREYIVGTIFYPFIKDTEVWGVAKIFDLSMLDAIKEGFASTSPFVVSENVPGPSGIYVEKLEDINHVAIVSAGHWDTDTPAIAGNTEIQMKEDLMADEKMPEEVKADANTAQVAPAAPAIPEKKADAEPVAPVVPASGDDQAAEDGRMAKLEGTVASLVEGMAAIKESLDALVASDKAVHETVEDDPVEGEEEEAKAQDVKALTEMADSAHSEVKIVKPVPKNSESRGEYLRRVIAHNTALLDSKYHGLAKAKIDASNIELAQDAFANIGVNAQKKSAELFKTASKNKGQYVSVGNGKTVDASF